MFHKLMAILVHPDDVPRDDDGACPACDHPFGQVSHMCVCFGPLRVAS